MTSPYSKWTAPWRFAKIRTEFKISVLCTTCVTPSRVLCYFFMGNCKRSFCLCCSRCFIWRDFLSHWTNYRIDWL